VGVVVALAVTAALRQANVNAWWVTPAVAVALLTATTSRTAHGRQKKGPRQVTTLRRPDSMGSASAAPPSRSPAPSGAT
jgi:hypothetical protein